MLKAPTNNDSLMNIVLHLCWGDIDTSKFFIEELVDSIKNRRSTQDLSNQLKILTSVLKLNDEF